MELPEIGNWLKPTDLDEAKKNEKNEVVAVFEDEGRLFDDQYNAGRTKLCIKVSFLLKNGDPIEKDWIMNWTSRKNLQTEYGKETKAWIGKTVYLWSEPRTFEGKTTRAMFGKPTETAEITKVGGKSPAT